MIRNVPKQRRNHMSENVNEQDLKRAETDLQIAEKAGFTLAAPIYALGTPVNEVGAKNYRASRKSFEKLPTFKCLAKDALATIEAEHRKDVHHNLCDLFMHEDGSVLVPNEKKPLSLSKRAFEQMLYRAKMPRGSASYLEACEPALRSTNMNQWLTRAADAVVLRTRKCNEGGREIYATLSDHRYHLYDFDKLAEGLLATVPTGARGEFIYDGSRYQLKAHFHSDIQPESAVAGEIFHASVIIDSADDGSRAIRVQAAVMRNLCRNLIILHTDKKEEQATHLDVDLETRIPELIKRACERVKGFAERWTEATRERIAEEAGGMYDVTPIFERLVDEGLIEMEGVADEEMIARLLCAWSQEPGGTRADVLNAITRAAHEETWGNPWAASELEEQAGKLLYNFQLWG
jgi:hypothetical protein